MTKEIDVVVGSSDFSEDIEPIFMTEKEEMEIRTQARAFKEEYVEVRKKAAEQGYESLTSEEKVVLEKGDDYLIG